MSVPVQPQLNARFGINAFSYDYNGNTSDVDYDAKLIMRTFDALLDYYPMSGNFRLSGGVVYNGNKIDANGRPGAGGVYTLNGRTYAASTVGSVDAQVDFRKFAPYLGIGWGNAVAKNKGWGFSTDLGVLFQGSPRTSMTHTGCTLASPLCAMLAADIADENRDLQNEVNDLKAFPVLRIGVSYSF
ncbi:hypothetical protein D3871_27535 [Noviherbaspirillum saxi]|uniref:Uncharacterized protein n=1 Tax=Noviherbaspirillum saxi TaxID=2320863 RepID=A0A3A3G412_9BURK|nr:hypothetical protein D3871_27535 [Noviherbaspirillum saxi]